MDGGSAQRRVVAVVAGRLVVAKDVKGGAEGVYGLALEAESHVGVDGGGDSDVGVAEEFLDHDEFDALFQEQGGGGVPEVVEADAAEAGLAEECGEGPGEVGRVDRSSLRRGEHVPVVLPLGARRVTVALLLFVAVLQRLETAVRESDAALGGPSLGGQSGEALCVSALQCSADGSGAPVEVEVFPAETEEFALAEPGVESEFEQGLQPVFVRGGEELAGFFSGEGFEASGPRRAGTDVAGDVARDLLLAHGVFQGGLEDGVDVGQCQRREPLGAACSGDAATGLITAGVDAAGTALASGAELVEPGGDVPGGELGELLLGRRLF